MSFLQRGGPASPEPSATSAPDDVATARSRARRRLIGAAVLLMVGVIGFPLLFETQPRPVAVDIPIVIPDQDRAAPLVLSQAPAALPRGDAAPAEVQERAGAPAEVQERAGDQGRELPPPAAAAAAAPEAAQPSPPVPAHIAAKLPAQTGPGAGAAQPSPKPEAAAKPAAPKPASAQSDTPTALKSAAKTEAARAQALLDGQAVAKVDEARVVVQVGAFAEAEAVRQARAKLDKLGMKSYTQVVDVGGARRTRVRVGPFSSRAEADKAAARIKDAGLAAAILTL